MTRVDPAPISLQSVVTIGGICGSPRQWDPLESFLLEHGYRLHVPEPHISKESGDPSGYTKDSFEDRVQKKVAELQQLGQSYIICHSFGAHIAAHVAHLVPRLVLGIIILDHGPIHGMSPGNKEADKHMRRWIYILPMIWSLLCGSFRHLRTAVRIQPEQEAFVGDGTPSVPFSIDSARLLLSFATMKACKIPPLSRSGVRTIAIIPQDGTTMPLEAKMQLAAYHGAGVRKVPGRHFAHYDPQHRDICFKVIIETLREWQSASS